MTGKKLKKENHFLSSFFNVTLMALNAPFQVKGGKREERPLFIWSWPSDSHVSFSRKN